MQEWIKELYSKDVDTKILNIDLILYCKCYILCFCFLANYLKISFFFLLFLINSTTTKYGLQGGLILNLLWFKFDKPTQFALN